MTHTTEAEVIERMAAALFKVMSLYVREANDSRRFEDVMTEAAQAALSAIHELGLVLVPREPEIVIDPADITREAIRIFDEGFVIQAAAKGE